MVWPERSPGNNSIRRLLKCMSELIKLEPSRPDGWRGLFLSYARDNQNQKALATAARFPAGVKSALTRDPEYLRTLAIIYQSEGRSADAERVLAQALALPFPDNGSTLKADTKLQYAGILMAAKHYDQAAALYVQTGHGQSRQRLGVDGAGERASRDGAGCAGHRRRGEDAAGHLRGLTRRSRIPLDAGRNLPAGQPV